MLLRLDPQAVASLGIFLPLIVVNGFVLHSLERNSSVSEAASDAVGKGAGFLIALVLVGAIRELLAYGTIFGATILNISCRRLHWRPRYQEEWLSSASCWRCTMLLLEKGAS